MEFREMRKQMHKHEWGEVSRLEVSRRILSL